MDISPDRCGDCCNPYRSVARSGGGYRYGHDRADGGGRYGKERPTCRASDGAANRATRRRSANRLFL